MRFELSTDTTPLLAHTDISIESSPEPLSSSVTSIESDKEVAALKKFDTYLVPVALIFIILSSLDRNNVSGTFPHMSSNH
jgi:hypothetical protein